MVSAADRPEQPSISSNIKNYVSIVNEEYKTTKVVSGYKTPQKKYKITIIPTFNSQRYLLNTTRGNYLLDLYTKEAERLSMDTQPGRRKTSRNALQGCINRLYGGINH